MNDTFPHDTSGGAASANTVRGRSGSTVGPSGSHYMIGPLQKASGPRKKEKTAMSHFWDTHHTLPFLACPGVVISLLQHLSVLVLLGTVHQAAKAQQIRAADLHGQQC